MYYTGQLKNTKTVHIFYSAKKPTQESHGNLYDYLFGGYKTKAEAIGTARFQFSQSKKIMFLDMRTKESKNSINLFAIGGIE